MTNPLKPLPTEQMAQRRKQMNKDADRLAKKDSLPTSRTARSLSQNLDRDWYAGNGDQPSLPTPVLVAFIAVLYIGLGVLAVKSFDEPVSKTQLTQITGE